MNPRLLLHIIALLFAALSASASELLPTRDDAQSLFAISPGVEFIVWWPDAKDQNPINHFPAFKATDSTFPLQYCRFDALLISLECSRSIAGEVVVGYTRSRFDARLSKQLYSESSGSMSVRRVYACTKGCGPSAPQRFALVLWNTGS